MACKNRNSIYIFCIFQTASSEQNVVNRERHILFQWFNFALALKFIYGIIRVLTQNISINIFQFVFARKKCLNIFICQLYFQICFAVQIFGLNVAYPIFIGRFKNKQIAWQRLVLFHFYYFARKDICPSFLCKFSSLNAVSCRQLVIFFSIRFVSFIIFKSIFDH